LLGPLKVPPLAVALVTCLALSSWAGGYFRSALRSDVTRVFVDDSTYVSNRLATLAHEASSRPKVVIVGGSVAREATPLDAEMRALISDRYGRDVDFFNLGSSNQSTLSSLVIVQSLAWRPGDVLVVQYSFKKLDTPAAVIRSEYLDPPVVDAWTGMFRHEMPSGIHFGDRLLHELLPDVLLHRSFINNFLELRGCGPINLVMQEQRAFCLRKMDVIRHYYKEAMSPSEKRDYVAVIRHSVLPNFQQHHQANQNLILQAAEIAVNSGAKVLFINPPVDEQEYALQREVDRAGIFSNLVAALSAYGRYLDWRFDDSYRSDMFRDSQHMLQSGKRQFATQLIDALQMAHSQ